MDQFSVCSDKREKTQPKNIEYTVTKAANSQSGKPGAKMFVFPSGATVVS